MTRNQYNIYFKKLGIQESIQDNDEMEITYNISIRRSMLHKPKTTMTTYILLGDGEELTAVNLHNHFSEEAKARSQSVSASTPDRFFGPGPVLQQSRQEASDLTEEFDLDLDQETQISCSSLTDTCSYPTLTSTSTLSTLDKDNNIVYPKLTSFESLSSLSLNSFDIDSIVSNKRRKKSVKDATSKGKVTTATKIVETPKDKKRKAPEKGKGSKSKKHKVVKEVSPTQECDQSDSDDDDEDDEDDEFEKERHNSKLSVKDSDVEYSSDSRDEEQEEFEVVKSVQQCKKATKKRFEHDDDCYDTTLIMLTMTELRS
eukprot:scaffold32281_cov50-Cyclotella_meneghiniana.AAC.6